MEEKDIRCLNCGNAYEGDFCPHCGQKAATRRLRMSEMAGNFINSFVGGDNMFLRTCCDLIIRPGHMVRGYLLGKRIRYYNPLQMYVFTLTVYAIVSYVLGISTSIFDDMAAFEPYSNDELSDSSLMTFIVNGVNALYTNKLYGTLFAILFAIAPYRFFFRKYRIARPDGRQLSMNCTEQFYAQMYHSCIVMIISIVLLPLSLIKGLDTVLLVVYQTASITYVVFMYKQLLGIGWMKSLVQNVLAVFLTIVLLCVAMGIVGLTAGIIDSLRG